MRKIDGRKAEVTDLGRRFPYYTEFAEIYGYPNAAHNMRSGSPDVRQRPQIGDIVTLLVSGKHDSLYKGDTLWIVEAANGERHIFNEKGLRILCEELSGVTVLKDESLGGIEREYREVKRKARVGERIKITNNGAGHGLDIGYICAADNEDFAEGWALFHAEESADPDYVVLEPTEIIRIDGKGDGGTERLRMVDRKAAVGERVIALKDCSVNPRNYGPGAVFEVEAHDYFGVDITDFNGEDNAIPHSDYRVLEPVEASPTAQLSAQPPLDQAAANIAALQTQVSGLEAKVAELAATVRTVIESANPAELSMSVSEVAAAVKVAEGPADDAPPSFAKRCQTLQEIRDEIVERAKADVRTLKTKRVDRVPTLNGTHAIFNLSLEGDFTDSVKFVVNRKKRTVTALIYAHGPHSKPFVWAVGRAKAAPNDVFNAHIGRAIALRRALGLEVPAEYLRVPNPEEPRVRDIVTFDTVREYGTQYEILTIEDIGGNLRIVGDNAGTMIGELANGEDLLDGSAIIIDDSREEVGA